MTPELPQVIPSSEVSEKVAEALNSLLDREAETAGLLQALATSIFSQLMPKAEEEFSQLPPGRNVDHDEL